MKDPVLLGICKEFHMTGSYVCKEKRKENSPERQAEAKTKRVLAILRNLHYIHVFALLIFY